MAARDDLLRFIEAARQSGASDDSVAGILKASGWSERDVYSALRDHYEQVTGVSVPLRRGFAEGARDAFLYLLLFGTLSTWILSLGSIAFSLIDRTWPDPVRFSYGDFAAQNLASILVAFPVFLLVSRAAVRDVIQSPDRRAAPVRRWLTYLALLIAAGVVIGDLIAFLAYLLQGEITMRFVAKVVTVFVLAAGVFVYYFTGLNAETRDRWYAGAACVAVAAGVIAGFSLLGSPAHQRQIGADRRRVENLRAIAWELHARPGGLPQSLNELKADRTDPVTGAPYEYRPVGGTEYELCATFEAPQPPEPRPAPYWRHGAGRECFRLDSTKSVP